MCTIHTWIMYIDVEWGFLQVTSEYFISEKTSFNLKICFFFQNKLYIYIIWFHFDRSSTEIKTNIAFYNFLLEYFDKICNLSLQHVPDVGNNLDVCNNNKQQCRDGILRVEAKFQRWHDGDENFPIRLAEKFYFEYFDRS